jgi:glycosyltransferase involved in cell wall biosynthesis
MTKTGKKKSSIINGKYYPLVSVCTPTFNRRPFIPSMLECFRNQTYPKHRIQWIIVDDGTDKIGDLVKHDVCGISQIEYYPVERKLTLGAKRNLMHTYVKGSFVVYMDDDDYYPPERIEHSVDVLQANPNALCAGASEVYVYFKHIQKMYQFGPYGPNHATAGTFAFRKELIDQSKYDDSAALAEEAAFLKGYSVPFVQLDPLKTILVFSHIHNTFDKRKLLDNPHPDYVRVSPKTVDTFIRKPCEAKIKKFFLEDIDSLLANYKPGEPDMKPDVLKQMVEIDRERAAMNQQQMQQQQIKIIMKRDGAPDVELSIDDIMKIVKQQQEQIEQMSKRMKEQDDIVQSLQKQAIKHATSAPTPSGTSSVYDKATIERLNTRVKEQEDMIKSLKKQLSTETPTVINVPDMPPAPANKTDPEISVRVIAD